MERRVSTVEQHQGMNTDKRQSAALTRTLGSEGSATGRAPSLSLR